MAGVGVYKSPTPPLLPLRLETRGEKDLSFATVSSDKLYFCILFVSNFEYLILFRFQQCMLIFVVLPGIQHALQICIMYVVPVMS